MASGRSTKLTGQIAEFLVCAELGRHKLIATPFSGNVPTFDILATDERCRTVPIQVKATNHDNWGGDARQRLNIEFEKKTGIQHNKGWADIENPDLIYVLVVIGQSHGDDRYFILTKSDIQKVCVQEYELFMGRHKWRRPKNPESYDCRYHVEHIEQFEDNWQLIIDRLNQAESKETLKIGKAR